MASERPAGLAPVQAQPQPLTWPRSGRALKQSTGGGKGMMVMGLVATVAGLEATYYMVKALKDQQRESGQQ